MDYQFGGLAHQEEHLFCKQKAVSSSLTLSTNLTGQREAKATKSWRRPLGRVKVPDTAIPVEHCVLNLMSKLRVVIPKDVGSIPTGHPKRAIPSSVTGVYSCAKKLALLTLVRLSKARRLQPCGCGYNPHWRPTIFYCRFV